MLCILDLMPRFKCEMNLFMGQLWWGERIAVRILHMGHPPKAMKYMTCGVMPFRLWQSFFGPTQGTNLPPQWYLSHSIYSLCMSPLLPFIYSACLLYSLSFVSFCLSGSIFSSLLPLLPFIIFYHSLYIGFLLGHGRHLRTVCHKTPQRAAVPWSRNPTLTLGFHPEII